MQWARLVTLTILAFGIGTEQASAQVCLAVFVNERQPVTGYEINLRGHTFRVNEAAPADRYEILNFVQKIRAGFGVATNRSLRPGTVDADLADIYGHYDGVKGQFLVVRNASGRIVATSAFGLAVPGENPICELRKVYVDPSAKGLGLGEWLVNAMISESRLLGYKSMYLKTYDTMTGALKLYDKMGFQPIRRPPVAPNSKANLFFQKELTR